MMLLTLLLSRALAATVYLNGVRVDVLPDATLNNVSVRLDAAGNVWITAPQYTVQEVPAAPRDATRVPQPAPLAASSPTVDTSPIPAGSWWLVSQDESAGGHVVDVVINGTTVRRVQSGEAQVLLDVSGYLHHGANSVRFVSPAGSRPMGGPLTIYVGRGATTGGTVRIERSDVRYAHPSSDTGVASAEEFVLQVP
jgi:hypothetical protein